jgi:hypothetical protein
VALLVYDVNDPKTLANLKIWKDEFLAAVDSMPLLVVLGNKVHSSPFLFFSSSSNVLFFSPLFSSSSHEFFSLFFFFFSSPCFRFLLLMCCSLLFQADTETAAQCQYKGDLPHFLVSAKTGLNIQQAFDLLATKCIAMDPPLEQDFDTKIVIRPTVPATQKPTCC